MTRYTVFVHSETGPALAFVRTGMSVSFQEVFKVLRFGWLKSDRIPSTCSESECKSPKAGRGNMHLIGKLIATAGILAAITFGNPWPWESFVCFPALFFVLTVSLGILISVHPVGAVLRLFVAVIRAPGHPDAENTKTAETAKTTLVVAGWTGAPIGIINVLCQIEDLSQIGKGLAIALLSALYGHLIAYLLFYPLVRQGEIAAKTSSQGQSLEQH